MQRKIMTVAAMCLVGGVSLAAEAPSVPLVTTKPVKVSAAAAQGPSAPAK